MAPRVCIDLSRSFHRTIEGQPTGIDRVEQASAEAVFRQANCSAVIRSASAFQVIDAQAGADLLAGKSKSLKPTRPMRHFARDLARHCDIYVAVGHNLPPAEILFELRRQNVRIVVMVHDIIPLTHPEFATPGTIKRMRRQWPAVAACSSAIIHLTQVGRERWQALFPVTLHAQDHHILAPPVRTPARSLDQTNDLAFLAIGTIEPRKNTAFLLDLWDALEETARPTLHIVGRAGWEEPSVLHRLRRATESGHLIWHDDMCDLELDRLLQTSQALLFPSLAEGFGLPVAEARLAGLPVIANTLPELAELHGNTITLISASNLSFWVTHIRKIISLFSVDSHNYNVTSNEDPAWTAQTFEDRLTRILRD